MEVSHWHDLLATALIWMQPDVHRAPIIGKILIIQHMRNLHTGQG